MQKAEKRFQAILKKSKHSNVTLEMLSSCKFIKSLCQQENAKSHRKMYIQFKGLFIGFVLSVFLLAMMFFEYNSECVIDMPSDASKIFREPENCKLCQGIIGVDRVMNISPQEFDEMYASKSRPVVITDGARDWTAVKTFDFEFFKNIYLTNGQSKAECQFFPYKTEFESLKQVLNMSLARSRLEPGTVPWYIGWSNCNDMAGKVLREHYNRPYFLPDDSENIALSWIFMGGPGSGAHMHVDNVLYPSWQAQLRGRKKWRLAPPPECLYSCQEFQVIVEPGEIIVVDTNRWYHQTHILPGEISITIGSEFD